MEIGQERVVNLQLPRASSLETRTITQFSRLIKEVSSLDRRLASHTKVAEIKEASIIREQVIHLTLAR